MAFAPLFPVTTIRARISQLVWFMAAAMAITSALASYSVYKAERDSVVEAAQETARALSLVADREFAVRAAVLRTLATSRSLKTRDIRRFYEEAAEAAPADTSIVLTDPSGQIVFNTLVPLTPGRPLGKSNIYPPDSRELVQVSDLFMGERRKTPTFAVRVGATVAGDEGWFLGIGSAAVQMQRIFVQQPLPPKWLGVLLDSKGFVVARTLEPEKRVGQRASEKMRQAIAASDRGMIEATTLDGTSVFTVFSRAPESQWTVLIGVEQSELQQAGLRAFGMLIAASAVFIALMTLIAWRIGRSIALPLQDLLSDADLLIGGERVRRNASEWSEVDVIQSALTRASDERAKVNDRLKAEVDEALKKAAIANQKIMRSQKLEALGRLTGGIAHDFNNLLQTMTTGLMLAARVTTDDRAKSALAACQRSTVKAVKLTRQLMTFGRTQDGNSSVIVIAELMQSFTELLRGAIGEGIHLVTAVDPQVPNVYADPVQLELAILNLAMNSRDAMRGQGTLFVNIEQRDLEGDDVPPLSAGPYVAISIRDTGGGMSAEQLSRAFEPFFTTKAVGKGTGLGLSQVYGFAQRAGGVATIDSKLYLGTEVTIYLPQTALLPTAPEPQVLEDDGRIRATLLLVEDDASVLQVIAQALRSYGIEVVVATDADDALNIAKSRSDIDVVLSDIVMPGSKSGIDLAKTLKVLRPALPVLLASGFADNFTADFGGTLIQKPYEIQEILRRLRDVLRGGLDA